MMKPDSPRWYRLTSDPWTSASVSLLPSGGQICPYSAGTTDPVVKPWLVWKLVSRRWSVAACFRTSRRSRVTETEVLILRGGVVRREGEEEVQSGVDGPDQNLGHRGPWEPPLPPPVLLREVTMTPGTLTMLLASMTSWFSLCGV